MTRTRSAGFGIEAPQKGCDDKNCPFHGTLKVRGNQFTGKVVSHKMQRSVTVEWEGWRFIPKYERYKRTRTKVMGKHEKYAIEKEALEEGRHKEKKKEIATAEKAEAAEEKEAKE